MNILNVCVLFVLYKCFKFMCSGFRQMQIYMCGNMGCKKSFLQDLEEFSI